MPVSEQTLSWNQWVENGRAACRGGGRGGVTEMSIATHCLMAHKDCAEQNVSLVTHNMYCNAKGNAWSYCILNSGCGVGEMERTRKKHEKCQECVPLLVVNTELKAYLEAIGIGRVNYYYYYYYYY